MMRARAKCQSNAGGVDGDPAAAPLFGDIGGGAGAAGGVEDEVAGIGGHQETALNDFCCCLDDIDLVSPTYRNVGPNDYRCYRQHRKVVEVTLCSAQL